jgi:hypothetical protein
MKRRGGYQNTQGETGPKVTFSTTNTIELAGDKTCFSARGKPLLTAC